MPTLLHGYFQATLASLIKNRGWRVASEVRVEVPSSKRPIPDLIADPDPIPGIYPTRPVNLCIEILSPKDELETVFQKGSQYVDWGCGTVWIIDPIARSAHMMTRESPEPVKLKLDGSLTAGLAEKSLTILFRNCSMRLMECRTDGFAQQ